MVQIYRFFRLRETAKLINFPGGERLLFKWLRDNRYLLQDNYPAQKYIDRGWFHMRKKILHHMEPKQVVPVTLVTIKGLAALERIVKKEFSPCPPVRKKRKKINKVKKNNDEQNT